MTGTNHLLRLFLAFSVALGYRRLLGDDEEMNCLVGKQRCLANETCKLKFESIQSVCGPSVFSCPSAREKECKKLLIELQTSEHFLTCTCESWINGTEECQEVQIIVFLHTCVIQGNYPNISWTFPRFASHMFGGGVANTPNQHKPHQNIPKQNNNINKGRERDDDDDDATEEGNITTMSCIGIRKTCLKDAGCKRLLTNYRLFCSENKKSQECLADDVDKCYDVIDALKRSTSDLFNCGCPMRRVETRERCQRIQWRIANNSCLSIVPYLRENIHSVDLTYNQLLVRLQEARISVSSPKHHRPVTSSLSSSSSSSSSFSSSLSSSDTCIDAVMACHKNEECRRFLVLQWEECRLYHLNRNHDNGPTNHHHNSHQNSGHGGVCNRERCLKQLKRFYSVSIEPHEEDGWRLVPMVTTESGDNDDEENEMVKKKGISSTEDSIMNVQPFSHLVFLKTSPKSSDQLGQHAPYTHQQHNYLNHHHHHHHHHHNQDHNHHRRHFRKDEVTLSILVRRLYFCRCQGNALRNGPERYDDENDDDDDNDDDNDDDDVYGENDDDAYDEDGEILRRKHLRVYNKRSLARISTLINKNKNNNNNNNDDDDNEYNNVCHVVRGSLVRPSCSRVVLPPPKCLDVVSRCIDDPDCRPRWKALEKYCDENNHQCLNNNINESHWSPCIAAQLSLAGTDLTLNCSCESQDKEGHCRRVRDLLMNSNLCKAKSLEAMMKNLEILNSKERMEVLRDDIDDWRSHCHLQSQDNIFSGFDLLSVRIYSNTSNDSKICKCKLNNNTIDCVRFPSPPFTGCVTTRGGTGPKVPSADRGNCLCAFGELVCAKSDKASFYPAQKQGLFMHVGFSQTEKLFLETKADVSFVAEDLTKKLSMLLNSGPKFFEDVVKWNSSKSKTTSCNITTPNIFIGNFLFHIEGDEVGGKAEDCIDKARLLARAINAKSPLVMGVAQLSILKVAQLEHVQFYQPKNSSIRTGGFHLERMHLPHRHSLAVQNFTPASHNFIFVYFTAILISYHTKSTVTF